MDSTDEKHLLIDLRDGSFQAFERLYNMYSGKLYNFIMRLSSGNQYMAEEIVQSTFIRIWEVREKVDADASFISFLCTIVKNLLMNMYQRQTVEYVYNEYLKTKKDIYLKVLKIKGRSMIYVYQKEKLNKLCACKQIQNIFKKYNYNCTSLDTLILDLQKRLNDYDFPHEIGLFLGYPMTDVLGFIEGKEYLSVGYWKVYSHVKNCQHTFDKYHKCTHELCKRFNQGESVEQICRYV